MPPPPSPAARGLSGAQLLRWGRFELRPREQRLLCEGRTVPVGGRAFDLLLALAERPGELLSRNELIERVWPGRVVEENNLSVQINALRQALGADAVATVPGRGYRLVLQPDAAKAPRLATPSEPTAVRETAPARTGLPV